MPSFSSSFTRVGQLVSRFPTDEVTVAYFTVACLLTGPLGECEAGVDSLLFIWCCYATEVLIKTKSTPTLPSLKNYHGRCLCYLRKPKLMQITQNEALIILAIVRKPNSIVVPLCMHLRVCKKKKGVQETKIKLKLLTELRSAAVLVKPSVKEFLKSFSKPESQLFVAN